ncbi:hypothetical protein ACFV2H_50630, partial [Streptomyces sp. NPDC059629]|uniref:hypothetical protein n=1 Tax=Streptomyces sp. NPDC059629 TaxID=3346889 RepID=UPI0036CB0497
WSQARTGSVPHGPRGEPRPDGCRHRRHTPPRLRVGLRLRAGLRRHRPEVRPAGRPNTWTTPEPGCPTVSAQGAGDTDTV